MTCENHSYLYPGYTVQAFAAARNSLSSSHEQISTRSPSLGRALQLSAHYLSSASIYLELPLSLIETTGLLVINTVGSLFSSSYRPNVFCCVESILYDIPKVALLGTALYSSLVRRILIVYHLTLHPIRTRVGRNGMAIDMCRYYRVGAIRRHGWKPIFDYERFVGNYSLARNPATALRNYQLLACCEDLNPYLEQAAEFYRARLNHHHTSPRHTPPLPLLSLREDVLKITDETSPAISRVLQHIRGNVMLYTPGHRRQKLCSIIGLPADVSDHDLKYQARQFTKELHPDKNQSERASDALHKYIQLRSAVLADISH